MLHNIVISQLCERNTLRSAKAARRIIAKTALALRVIRRSIRRLLPPVACSCPRARHRGAPTGPPPGTGARAGDGPAVSVDHPLASLPRCPNPGMPGLLTACRTEETAVGLANCRMGQVQCPLLQRIVH